MHWVEVTFETGNECVVQVFWWLLHPPSDPGRLFSHLLEIPSEGLYGVNV